MNGETIAQFLVGLGFGVDDGELSKFNKALSSATLRVFALSTAIVGAAGGVASGIASISEDFEKIGYEFHLIAPAINKTLELRQEMLKAYSAAGINITRVVQNSVKLNMSLTKTKYALEAIYKSVGSRFFTLLTKQSDLFRKQIYANMPKIQATLEKFVKFIFKAFEAVTTLGLRLWSILTRVYDFFVELDKATDGWSTVILAVVAAWKLLNLTFLASPLGLILAGIVGILALYDDFKTFGEGGKSLLNWGPLIPVINAVKDAFASALDTFKTVLNIFFGLFEAGNKLIHLDFKGFGDTIKQVFKDVIEYVEKLIATYSKLGTVFSSAASWAKGVFSGDTAIINHENLKNNPVGAPLANPIGSNNNTTNVNQNVNQQTSITVSGSADANSTARHVTNGQQRVNQDLVRNMKGSTR